MSRGGFMGPLLLGLGLLADLGGHRLCLGDQGVPLRSVQILGGPEELGDLGGVDGVAGGNEANIRLGLAPAGPQNGLIHTVLAGDPEEQILRGRSATFLDICQVGRGDVQKLGHLTETLPQPFDSVEADQVANRDEGIVLHE